MKNWILLLSVLAVTVEAAQLNCNAPVTTITEIQGNGKHSAQSNQLVTVKGVITGDFRGKNALEGFFIQQLKPDNDIKTSEGLFIHHRDTFQKLQIGDVVMVKGRVSEQFDVTQITQVAAVKVCEREQPLPEAVLIPLPLDGFDLESVEGMLVSFEQPVVITDLYPYLKYGEIIVSSELLLNPTARFRPGNGVNKQYQKDKQNRLIIDDGSFSEFPKTPLYNKKTPITLGQKVNVTGVMHYAFGKYKIQPTQDLSLLSAIEIAEPQLPIGTLKIANFNLKNFFTTIDPGEEECGPWKNFGCRGADSTAEFKRQVRKLATAIIQADADVLAVQELENIKNSGQVLVDALNQAVGKTKWSFIKTGVLGDDAIKVGLLYQPEKVKPVGQFALLNNNINKKFDETKHRIVVAQTFLTQSNNKVNVVAAHFKSKSCQDAKEENLDQKDGQGCFNASRVEAAQLVSSWLLTDPTQQGAEYTILAGDLNSYQKEAPITVLQKHGFKNLAENFLGEKNWTASYRGYVGSLDYILVNADAKAKATGLIQWHINSIYSSVFDYNLEPFSENHPRPEHFYQPTPMASSDHDMVIATFDL